MVHTYSTNVSDLTISLLLSSTFPFLHVLTIPFLRKASASGFRSFCFSAPRSSLRCSFDRRFLTAPVSCALVTSLMKCASNAHDTMDLALLIERSVECM